MAARPVRQFAPIQNTTVQFRRGNTREAANDFDSDYQNDNDFPGPPVDIASRFNQQSYTQQYPQEENKASHIQSAGKNLRRTGTAVQAGGKATAIAGKTAVVGGRALQRGGGAMVRAGGALSTTGIGALAGVPLMIAGGATAATGTGMQTTGTAATLAGRHLDRSGRMMRKVGGKIANDNTSGTLPSLKKLANPKQIIDIQKKVKAKVAVSRINLTTLSIATPIWFTIQFPLALASLGILGLAATAESIEQTIIDTPVVGLFYSAQDFFTNSIEYATGINLNPLEAAQSVVLYGSFSMLVFFIGIITLGFMATMYLFSGVRCFFGTHAALKSGLFIFAILGYLMPGLNILPWFMLWGIVVWCYPK